MTIARYGLKVARLKVSAKMFVLHFVNTRFLQNVPVSSGVLWVFIADRSSRFLLWHYQLPANMARCVAEAIGDGGVQRVWAW